MAKRSHGQTSSASSSSGSDGETNNTHPAAKRRCVEGPSDDQKGKGGRRGQSPARGLPRGDRDAEAGGKAVRYDLPPLTEFPEMMEDMVARAVGSQKVPGDINLGKTLPIATMCSGSEAPLLACLEICRALARRGQMLAFDHLFSAEIVQYKQAYIERNFSPSIIFSDIRDMVRNGKAITAYGGMAVVPGGVSLLVAGSSCVDFSKLNPRTRGIDEWGESGDTFRSILHYARQYRPRAIILENVKTADWEVMAAYAQNNQAHPKIRGMNSQGQLQAIWGDDSTPNDGYSTAYLMVDTKDYYLPQTRARGYMFCVDRSKIGREAADQLVRQWIPVFRELRRPASSPMEELFLSADHPSLLRAREFGHLDEHGEKKVRKETKWRKCRVRYARYRDHLALGNKRPLTNSVEGGPIFPPEHWSKLWASIQPDRLKEHWDQAHLRNARQGGFDSQYKTRIWELSQNIDRATDSGSWGIAPCVTPTAVPFATTRGGLLTAFESLRLQGQPLDRIDTGNIGESSIQDLAGNAMSTTVVAAAILAALKVAPIYLVYGLQPDPAPNASLLEEVPTIKSESFLGDFRTVDLSSCSSTTVTELILLADSSIRRCTCEGQAGNTASEISECQDCDHTTCAKCKSIYVHRYRKSKQVRSLPTTFRTQIQSALPMRLSFGGEFDKALVQLHQYSQGTTLEDIKTVSDALKQATKEEFRYFSVLRSHCWTVTYEANSLSLKLVFHHSKAIWQLFIKPKKTLNGNSRIRTLARYPIARLVLDDDTNDLLKGTWEAYVPIEQSHEIEISGQGTRSLPSWKNSLGLPNHHGTMVFEYLDLQTDAEIVSGDHTLKLAGTYQLLPRCETASAGLHKKTTKESDGSQIYFFLDPQRNPNPLPDRYVFAHTTHRLDWKEMREVIARMHTAWMPADQEFTDLTVLTYGRWVRFDWELMSFSESKPITFAAMENTTHIEIPNGLREEDLGQLQAHSDCNTSHFALLSIRLPSDVLENQSWDESRVSRSTQQAIARNFAWVFQRLHWPSIFSSEWIDFPRPTTSDICRRCVPELPNIRFARSKVGARIKIQPYEHSKQAALFEKRFKARLPIILSILKKEEVSSNEVYGRLDVGVNWSSLLHRAMGKLPFQLGDNIKLQGRIEPIAHDQASIKLPKFTLPNSKCSSEADYTFPTIEELRPEQLRALQQMIDQETNDDPLNQIPEQAREEDVLPEYGLRIHALFSKHGVFPGGVLAHEVGFGKTAIVLALIDKTRDPNLTLNDVHGKINCKATLILVPATIVKQWQQQVSKFLGPNYKVLPIADIPALGKLAVGDIEGADIIICSSKLLSSPAYLESISMLGNLPVQHNNSDRLFGAWYDWASRNMAANIEDMKTNGLTNIANKLTNKFVEMSLSDELVRPDSSRRLRGQAYSNDSSERNSKKKSTEVDATQDPDSGAEEGTQQDTDDESDGDEEMEEQPVYQSEGGQEESDEESLTVWPGDDGDEMEGVEMEAEAKSGGRDEEAEAERPFAEGERREPRMYGEPTWAYSGLVESEEERRARNAGQVQDLDEEEAPQGDDDAKEKEKEKEQRRQGALLEAAKVQKRFKFGEATGFGNATKLKSMNFPILHLFQFHRLVVDEVTYVDDIGQVLIAAIRAPRRWVLSGTPKLGDFMDIKKLARFINFDLGEDDDTPKVMKQYNIIKLRKEQTAAEQFRGLNKQRTMEFHLDRQMYAQDWLNQFARQDQPEFEEIDLVTRYVGVQLTCNERSHLLEMINLVQDSQVALKTPKSGLSRLPDNKVDHIKTFMKGQTDAVKALLGIICEQYIPALASSQDRPVSAAEASLMQRQHEYQSLSGNVLYTLKKTIFLQGRLDDLKARGAEVEKSPWEYWLEEMFKGKGGVGSEVLSKFTQTILFNPYKSTDTDLFMRKKPKANTKKSKTKPKNDDEDDMLANTAFGALVRSLSITSDPRIGEIHPSDCARHMLAIKSAVLDLGNRAEEMLRRLQDIRLAKALIKCRDWVASTQPPMASPMASTPVDPPQCPVCRQPCPDPVTTMVLGSCGHIICDGCFSKVTVDIDKCPFEDCNGVILKSNVYSAQLLGAENHNHFAQRYGAKVGKIIELFKRDIPHKEQVLIFVQDDRFIEKIAAALDAENITNYALADNKKGQHGRWMFAFQEDTGEKARRALILDATKDSAAGANLTNANHVIFLGTLWTDDQHTYHQSLTQCIGRAKRFGQKKTVHVYKLLALHTVDVDVLEWREGKKLVELEDKSLDLVDESEMTAEQRAVNDFSTGFLRDNGYFQREE